jgi:hypothetical protein
MSVLRTLETKIADLVEGAFGRAFRSGIQPVELARRLTREMDRHRTNSLSNTFVPNAYVVWLSNADRREFAPIEDSLVEELAAYLLDYARGEHLALASPPQVELRTDPRLRLGECGIEANLVRSAPRAAPVRQPARAVGAPPPRDLDDQTFGFAFLIFAGKQFPIPPAGVVIGRSPDADVVIASSDVSRRHAEILPEQGGWVLVDLGSTNGVRLNDRAVGVPTLLTDGDVIEIGSAELVFEVH